ncbi:hypothetical protein [Laspinema olomoucense]|nr:hypothetical protein [Laspinema sp. D3d]MCT7974646.1 hypothetical protein [Laspinema sp. D3d]
MDGVSEFLSHSTGSCQTEAIALQSPERVEPTGSGIEWYSMEQQSSGTPG